MKIALDPYMLRGLPFGEVCRIAAEIGFDAIELSPRPEFIPFFTHPRADRARVAEFRTALRETGLELSSVLPLYRWSSPDEDERLAGPLRRHPDELCLCLGGARGRVVALHAGTDPALPRRAAGTRAMSDARVGIGLVGAGRMGSIHARLVHGSVPGARLVGIADVNVEAGRRLSAQVVGPPVFGSIDALLETPGLDAVLIATSSSRHLEMIRLAASAGKEILCEKPIALTLADTDAAIDAAARAGVRLQVGFMRRWEPDYVRAKARLASGAYGRPMLFKSLQFDPEPPPLAFADPAVSGGIMIDMGIHEFDLARWLMADEVVEVHAFGSTYAHPGLATVGDVDSAVVNLRFASGATGSVELARNTTYGEDVRTEVLATNGSVWIGLLSATQGASSGGGTSGTFAVDALAPTIPRFERGLAAQLRGFVGAIVEDRPVEVTGADGRAAFGIAVAAGRSMREGRPVEVERD